MVARGEKSRCQSPCFNVHVELDNRALKAKNNTLTQTVAKLQQDNADLLKQITFLQRESFEINSRYNNLKNVISIIDSTTKTCLPKLTEVVDTFTGIIQLCSVASNISNANKDTRTQAVKPQIVNGHVLHIPTITLSRLINNDSSRVTARSSTSRTSSNVTVRPTTSHTSSEANPSENSYLNDAEEENINADDNVENRNGDGEQDSSFVCQATRGVCKQSSISMDTSRFQEDDDSEDEMEEPVVDEEDIDDEDQRSNSDQRLTPIQEDEEEDDESPLTPRARQRRFLKSRLQEVKIYLNQLPNTYVDQFRGSDENVSPLSRSLRDEEDSKFNDSSTMNGSRSKLTVSIRSPLSSFGTYSDTSNDERSQFTENVTAIHNLPSPSNSSTSGNSSHSTKSLSRRSASLPLRKSKDNSLHSKTYSPNKSPNDSGLTFKTNITKRRTASEKRKVAQVLLDRISLGNRFSGSPLNGIKDIVNTPPITKASEIKTQVKSRRKGKTVNSRVTFTDSNEDDLENIEKPEVKNIKKKDSPTKKVGSLQKKTNLKLKVSPQKNLAGRPKRAARPVALKETSLKKKMRRSK